MKKLSLVLTAALLMLSTLALAGSPAGSAVQPATATAVRVVHAIPGTALSAPEALPVDISVNGGCALTEVPFGAVAEVELTGPIDVEISLANTTTPCANAAVIDVDGLALPAGEQVSLVAHLDADGNPTASVFSDDLSGTDVPGEGVVAVRHTAAAPAVEAWLGAVGSAAPTGLTIANSEQIGRVELAAGNYDAGLGTSETLLFGPATVPVAAGEVLAVYATGVFGEDSFQLITDTFALPSRIDIVHGIPGTALSAPEELPVDISIDGVCLLTEFEFGQSSGRVALEADDYDIAISLANTTAPCSNAPVISVDDLTVPSDADLTIVAHLDADGNPTASVFVDDLTPTTPATRSAVAVRHTAAAPTVEVWLGAVGSAAATGLTVTNGTDDVNRVDLATASYDAGLGTSEALLFGPATLDLAEDQLLAVYAVGVFGEDSFQLITQTTSLTRGTSGDGGYGLVSDDTSLTPYGTFGAIDGADVVNHPPVDAVATNTDEGYWLVANDGGVFALGDAGFFGSMGGQPLNAPAVGIDATPSNNGYWLVASDGGVFAFGDAGFFGSMGGMPLNQPIVDIAATPTGNGYWLVAADGGVFAFGDASFHGSLGNLTLNQPIVDMAVAPGGAGYWLVAADGGVFTFGDIEFYGSAGAQSLGSQVVGITTTSTAMGYWIATADGQVLGFGDANVIDGDAPAAPVVDIIG